MTETLGLLALIAAVAVVAFLAGWRSCKAHYDAANSTLQAAITVSDVTRIASGQSANFKASLDNQAAEAASLRQSVEQNTRVVGEGLGNLHGAIETLIVGLERGGLVRTARNPGPGRQVGEKSTE